MHAKYVRGCVCFVEKEGETRRTRGTETEDRGADIYYRTYYRSLLRLRAAVVDRRRRVPSVPCAMCHHEVSTLHCTTTLCVMYTTVLLVPYL
jgi:hypothetical protein